MDNPNNKTTNNHTDAQQPDFVERVIYGIVLGVIAVVPLLTFAFSFGNVGDLGVKLGIDWRIAYLTGPAVDLTATGMIVAATWLSHRGMSEKDLWRVHTLSIICALVMFALNCGSSIYDHKYRLAAFNAVGPFLLMAMGFVGPWLLRQLADTKTSASVSDAERKGERKPEAAGTGIQPATPAEAAASTSASTAVSTVRPDGSRTGSPSASTPARTASIQRPVTGSRAVADLPVPIQRADRLKIVRALIEDAGGVPENLPLKVIQERFGVAQATASRMRADAAAPQADADGPADAEPERAWEVS